MTIQIYILSKLLEGNTYPYKLKKALAEPIPFDKLGNLTESKLYYHFDVLKKQGLIEAREIIQEENRPDKQVFAITDAGRAQLPHKIYDLFEKAKNISEMVVGITFLHHVEPARIAAILQSKLYALEKKQQQFAHIYANVEVEAVKKDNIDFVHAYFSDKVQREIQWLQAFITKLKQ